MIPSNERSGMIVKQIMHVERGTLTVGEPQYDKGPASPTLGSLTSPCAEPFLVAIFGRSNAYLRNVRSRFGSFDIFPRFEHISSAPASFGVASCVLFIYDYALTSAMESCLASASSDLYICLLIANRYTGFFGRMSMLLATFLSNCFGLYSPYMETIYLPSLPPNCYQFRRDFHSQSLLKYVLWWSPVPVSIIRNSSGDKFSRTTGIC